MSTLPSFDRLLGAMSGTNSTSDWDVLVSYSVTKLNTILPSLWQGDTFNDVLFNRDYLDFGLRTAAHLSIGAPTLQFVAGENAKALLTMKLQGWLRTDTLNVNPDTGEIISVVEGGDNTKVNIAPGRYQLQAAVPLVNMTGDASIQVWSKHLVQHGQHLTRPRRPDKRSCSTTRRLAQKLSFILRAKTLCTTSRWHRESRTSERKTQKCLTWAQGLQLISRASTASTMQSPACSKPRTEAIAVAFSLPNLSSSQHRVPRLACFAST